MRRLNHFDDKNWQCEVLFDIWVNCPREIFALMGKKSLKAEVEEKNVENFKLDGREFYDRCVIHHLCFC